MSRAFVKEPDGDERPPERPRPLRSTQPNYITPAGLERLRERLRATAEERARLAAAVAPEKERLAALDEELGYVAGRVDRAIVIDPAAISADDVRFGATVRVADDDGAERTFAIVGEDEADPARGRIAWVAPLAHAVLGAHAGEVVTWERPGGAIDLEILEISYVAID